MVSRRASVAKGKAAGFAMVEVLAAVAVLTVLGVGSFAWPRGARAALARGFDETRATWLLTERLELARAAPELLVPGLRCFDLAELPGASIVEVVERIEPRLLAVRAELHRPVAGERVAVRSMTTWIALEVER